MGARADGLRKSEAFEETEELLGLAGRIADREPVDWAAELGRPERAAERPFLRALEAIDRLGAISGGIELELPSPAASPPRERWGDLELLGLLGKGSYGAVHVARDPQLDRLIALKIFRGVAGSERARRDALREGRLLARLKHPNVATVYGFDEREGELGLRMELVRGQTLAQRVAEQGPMGALEAALAGVEICRALAAAHAAGILHRDVKAQNVVREEGGRLVLVDFGLGLENAAAEDARPSGTPLYLAPEIVAGRAASERSDLYALGVTLYHLVTGGYPVEAESREELVDRLARGVRRPLRDRRPDLPQPFVEAVERALALRPEERFTSAGEMEQALLQLVSSRRPSGRLRTILRLTGTVALVAGLGSAALLLIDRGPGSSQPAGSADLVPRRLTSAIGREAEAAISPDGTLVAYVSNEGGNPDLWLVDSRGGTPIRLTDDPAVDRWPAWLPDGRALVFESERGGRAAIWRVDRLGGPATFLLADAGEPAVSPDGGRLAVAVAGRDGQRRIGVVGLEAPDRPRLVTGDGVGFWDHRSPSWSPDGRLLAYVDLGNLWIVPAAGGESIALASDGAGYESPSWSSDGRFVYAGSFREGTLALWRFPVTGGAPERITLGSGAENHPRPSRDGGRLAYTTTESRDEIVLAEFATGRVLSRIRSSGSEKFPTFAPDGSALGFTTTRRGATELRIVRLENGAVVGEPRPAVASPAAITHPAFSPDGRHLVYQRRLGSQRDIYLVAATGGAETPVVDGPELDLMPAWTPDGSRISFVRQVEDGYSLWSVELDGAGARGEPRPLAALPVVPQTQAWSPDGVRIALVAADATSGPDLWLLDVAAERAPRRLTHGMGVRRARWLDGSRLAVSGSWGERTYSLRIVDSTSGDIADPPSPVEFGPEAESVSHFDFPLDRGTIAFSRHEVYGDVWVLEGVPGSF